MVCLDCLKKLGKLKNALGQCRRCGSFGSPTIVCNNCRSWPKYLVSNVAAVPYEQEYREVLHLLKFRKQGWLVPPLIDLMRDLIPHVKIDLIIPVPLHPNRFKERGFNQSGLLAQELALRTTIPYEDQILVRQLDTPHQTGLDLTKRQINLLGAFNISNKELIFDKNILLIDDNLTTGTTLLECAKTLHKGGARCIYGLTYAAGIK